MIPYILSLGTSVPDFAFSQSDTAAIMIELLSLQGSDAMRLRKLYKNSAINTRHSVIGDFKKPRSEWAFWGENYPAVVPGMSMRNVIYREEAPKLAYRAADAAIKEWGGNPLQITHIISVSCTGVIAPGIEFQLLQTLGLSPSTARLGINFMGCFGAFKGLAIAQALARENGKNRVLLVCTELCSLHLQSDLTPDTLVANALFSDGAAAAIIGCEIAEKEVPLWEMVKHASLAIGASLDKMSWEACDTGFCMRLSQEVPELISRNIMDFAGSLLDKEFFSTCNWAIHPGGKGIVKKVEEMAGLRAEQTQASWKTLADYGNMSSATFLFVLNALREQKNSNELSLGLGFGPGLSMEGILLRAIN